MGNRKKEAAKIAVFLLLAASLVNLSDRLLANGTDNHKYLFQDFYDAPADEVDVVYMGPSSAGWNWNPTVAYREHGVGSQLLTSERHPADAFPYLLKEAGLKKPDLYIIDAQQLMGSFSGDFAAVQGILTNLSRSKNRLDAADDMLEHYSDEEKQIRYLPLLYFHSRWKELNRRDFEQADTDFMGFSVRAVSGTGMPEGREQLEAEMQTPSQEHVENLEEVLRVCKSLDGKVLFMVAPNARGWGGYYKYISKRVTEAGFDYLNASDSLDEIGLEPGDFEGGVHLTVYGAEKYTAWLSGVIAKKYGLPDRRKEQGYREAARYEQAYEAYVKAKVTHGVMLSKYLESISDSRYSVLAAVRDEASGGLKEDTIEKLRQFGLQQTPAGRYRASYLAVLDRGELMSEQMTEAESGELLQEAGTLKDGTSYILQSGGLMACDHASIIINGVDYAVNARGMNIVVYDNAAHEVIDSVAFDTCSEELAAVRTMPQIDEIEMDAAAARLHQPEDGTEWNASGNTIIADGQAVKVCFDNIKEAGSVSLSLDADDAYNVMLCVDDKIQALYTVRQDTQKQGMRTADIDVAGVLFDSIKIIPIQKNGGCSFGHLIVK